MLDDHNIHDRMLDVKPVAQRLDVSTDTIYRWKRQGCFPKAVN